MPTLGFQELLIILLICVLIFGGSKLSQIGKGLGEGIRNFKHAVKDGSSKDDNSDSTKH